MPYFFLQPGAVNLDAGTHQPLPQPRTLTFIEIGVIEKISGIKSSKEAPIGWHTLRRSLATLLISNGENVKVAQSQLRHTTPKIALELYAQAVSADQQEAHKKVVQMVLPAGFSEKLKARSVTATA